MQDLTNQADQLLPGPAGSKEEASQPLKQRLAEAWNGKVRCRWQSAVHPCCGCYDMGADWCIEQLTATVLFVCFQRMAAVTLAQCQHAGAAAEPQHAFVGLLLPRVQKLLDSDRRWL